MTRARARWPEVLAAIAGLALIASLFLRWWGTADAAVTGLDHVGVLDVVLALAGLAGIALMVVAATHVSQAVPIATASLALIPALAALVGMVIRVLKTPDVEGIDTSRGPGVWLALASAVALLAGVLASMRDERITEGGPPVEVTTLPPPRTPSA